MSSKVLSGQSFSLDSCNGSIGRLSWERAIMATVENADRTLFEVNRTIAEMKGALAELERQRVELENVKARGNREYIKSICANI